MRWLQAHLSGAALSAVSAFSAFGEELFLILVVGFLYWCWDKGMGRRVGLIALMGSVWNPMIKNAALRRRPYMDHEGIDLLRLIAPEADAMNIAAQGYSFPSGHSTNIMGIALGLAREIRKKRVAALAVLLILLVGFSRIAMGAHYPTDVLGGWAVGVLAALLVPWLQRKIRSQTAFLGVLLLTALPGFFFCRSEDYYTCVGLLVGFLGGSELEERIVRFENTRSPLRAVLRLLGGVAVFLLLNKALKAVPLPQNGETARLLMRSLRYAVIAFLMFGVYPVLFRFTAGIGRKQ